MRMVRLDSSLCLVIMWSWAFWGNAFGQSSSARPSGSSTSTTPTLSISVSAFPTLTACATARLQWQVVGNNVTRYNVSFYALGTTPDDDTSQAASSARPSSTASRAASSSISSAAAVRARSLENRGTVSETIGIRPASDNAYDFIVSWPAGRYYINAKINDPSSASTNSQLFSVVEGTDTSCLTEGSSPVSASRSASVAASTTASTSNIAGAAATSAAGTGSTGSGESSGLSGGAIAGVAIGALAGTGAILAFWFFCIRRRKRQTLNISAPDMRNRGVTTFGNHFAGGAAIPDDRRSPRHGDSDRRSNGGHIALTSMGGSAESNEKDEGPFVGSYGSSEAGTPVYLSQLGSESPGQTPITPITNPFASAPNTPMANQTEFIGAPSSAKEDRRKSQPISGSPSRSNSRSNSQSEGTPQTGVKRSVSARRKPVPSLGAELRDQLRNETNQRQGRIPGEEEMSRKEVLRSSYQIMPDPPRRVDE